MAWVAIRVIRGSDGSTLPSSWDAISSHAAMAWSGSSLHSSPRTPSQPFAPRTSLTCSTAFSSEDLAMISPMAPLNMAPKDMLLAALLVDRISSFSARASLDASLIPLPREVAAVTDLNRRDRSFALSLDDGSRSSKA